jgi:hypothetical protein
MTAAVNALADQRFAPPVVATPAMFRATFTIRIAGRTRKGQPTL